MSPMTGIAANAREIVRLVRDEEAVIRIAETEADMTAVREGIVISVVPIPATTRQPRIRMPEDGTFDTKESEKPNPSLITYM